MASNVYQTMGNRRAVEEFIGDLNGSAIHDSGAAHFRNSGPS